MAKQTEKQGKKRRHLAQVLDRWPLTPHMQRVVLGGEGLRGFSTYGLTDHYVKLELPPPGADYRAPYDLDRLKQELPKKQRPRTRSYTVRDWDPDSVRLTLDIVHHGPTGIGGPWVTAVEPGEQVYLKGPGGGYRPDPEADWHLMVGDEAAIPAIAVSLAAVPEGVGVLALVEVENAAGRVPLTSPGQLELTWVHREDSPGVNLRKHPPLLDTLRAAALPEGRGEAFIHGEAKMVRAVRKHLVLERDFDRMQMSASGYWKRNRDDETWRAEKDEWKRQAELDLSGE